MHESSSFLADAFTVSNPTLQLMTSNMTVSERFVTQGNQKARMACFTSLSTSFHRSCALIVPDVLAQHLGYR